MPLLSNLRNFFDKLKDEPARTRKYHGAARGRLYGDWTNTSNSANAEIWTSLTTLRNRSRDLCRNNDYARGVIQKLVDNVVYFGISFQAQVKNGTSKTLSGQNDEAINNEIEKAWQEWATNKKYCHPAGKLNFAEIQQLAFKSVLESGEVFVRKVKIRFDNSPIPFALEIIEADQCAEEHNTSYGGNQVVMGVEINEWKRPVAYWFYKDHPGDLWQGSGGKLSRELQRIPADEIIHLHTTDRPGQLRGVPILYSTLIRLKNIGDYEESEQIAAKAAACIMGLITTPDSDLLGEPGNNDDSLPADEVMKPGVMRYLGRGETFEGFDPKRPNPNVAGFIECQLRASGAGIGASYETMSNDYSKSNYSSSRLSLITARDRYKVLQIWFINNFNAEVYADWLDLAVLGGRLNFSDYEMNVMRYREIRWQPRGWSWVDPYKEIQATIASLKAGITTMTAVAAEAGQDFEENVKTIAREREILRQHEVSISFDGYSIHESESDGNNNSNSKKDVVSERSRGAVWKNF